MSTSPRQFGYKKSTGCNHATHLLIENIEYFTKNGSTVNIGMLDLSKAFDKLSHFGLFTTLLNRHVPRCIITILINWYAKIYSCVSWNGSRSDIVHLLSGVRQGGILSPIFFSTYVNDLLIKLGLTTFGCFVHGICFNSLMYADDIVLIALSTSDLRKLCISALNTLIA